MGLTDYSHWSAAKELRRCLPASPQARAVLLQLALDRLDRFIHVGLAERIEDSISSLAGVLGIDLDAASWSVRASQTLLSQCKL